jgi:hypothetical protein
MSTLTEERLSELETRGRHYQGGAHPAACLSAAVLELAAALRAEPEEPTPLEPVPPPAIWSAERPTVAGCYWFRVPGLDRPAEPVLVSGPRPDVFLVRGIGVAPLPLADWSAGEWCGPVEVPS